MQNPSRCSLLVLVVGLLLMSFFIVPMASQNDSAIKVDVGLILDTETTVGKMSQTCMSMALEDFYVTHNYTTRIVLQTRYSKGDVVEAASAAIDLLKNVQVQAILGPETSTQADFVIDIGNKSQVPIISLATSPSLSPMENPYFVRVSQNGSAQVEALTAIVKAFSWREIVLISEDSNYGSGLAPYLTNSLLGINTQVRNQSVISISASDDHILQELYKLKTMQTRVFVVHMLPSLASRLFLKAKEVGMMSKGYTWIITDGLTSLLDSMDRAVIDSMQGVLGLKPYVPQSSELDNFTKRWRKKFLQENPEMDRFELNVFVLWAYDSVKALAMAVEKAGIAQSPRFKKPVNTESLTDLAAIGTSEMGPRLLQSIRNIRFKGLSGDFNLVDGQLQSSAFQIVNVIGKEGRVIGFWTSEHGISKEFGAIIWPGESNVAPKGWEIPTGERKLRVGVPVKGGFVEFIKVETDAETNAVVATGFCIDVFEKVMNSLQYAVPYEYFPFKTPDAESTGSYDDLVHQIVLENFDAVVGDLTILSDRSKYVDFTLPYTESGVSMIVRIEAERKNAWIFMKPLTLDLWLTTGAFFVFTGFVVWVLEHRINKEFRGPPRKQVGMIFWFSFSTLVFAHKERLISNLARFVVIVWVFVVLVLTSSYTASLTSMLTVQKLQPSFTDVSALIKNGEYVGYQTGSFVAGLLKKKNIDPSKSKNYSTFEEYDDALTKGSKNGGVAVIIDELPYIRPFLAKYCSKYTMVGPIYRTAGFGFAFPKGSPLVPDVSRAILNVTEGEDMTRIQRQWFGEEANCAEQEGSKVVSDSLTLDSFKGLFLIAAVSSFSALIIFLSIFLYDNRNVLTSNEYSIREKIAAIAKNFDEEKDKSSDTSKRTNTANGRTTVSAATADTVPSDGPQSLEISISHQTEGIFYEDEGFSTTGPGTPIHETIEIVETNEER
ncbi:unnamed protein product [Camellia sinensis]